MSDSVKESVVTMLDELADEHDDDGEFDAESTGTRHDIRRKIEDLLERKRLREEFGDFGELDW